jgi:cyclopropane fatty-acyl-phospholipid synthase-like methyltransferase
MQTPDVPRAYDLIAEKFFADRSIELREKKYLDLALAGLPAGAAVLDFGCGTGRPIGEYVVARGYVLTGVDGSARMLEIARRNLAGANLIHARMEDIELAGKFSGAIVWDSLFHVQRDHHAAIYGKLARWIQPGGRLLLSTGGSGDAGFTSEMHGEVFFYSSWTPEKVVALLRNAGFTVEVCEMDQPESRGHLVIVARREASTAA